MRFLKLTQVTNILKLIMQLSRIPKYIDCKKIYNFKKKNISFNFISTNSKNIKKNSILFIDKKNKFKRIYVKEAIQKGAVAIITNYYYKDIKLPQFIVNDINSSLKILLFVIKKCPPNNIVGITGTNGKTSVLWNIINIAYLSHRNTKSYGTLGFYINTKKKENSILTTPEYEILHQKSFKKSVKNNFDFIFEVSSHSISKKRIEGFPINIAAITNISQDHLDFHKNINNYRNTKFKLFSKYLKNRGTAILNKKIVGFANLRKILLLKEIKIITFGTIKSDVYCYNKNNKLNIKIYNKVFTIKSKNYYSFELDNLSCSIACCIGMDIKNNDIISVIPKIDKTKGRLQEVGKLNDGSKVFVDYAHTPDALKNILKATTLNNKKPNLVFGCGGDRDKSKRKIMGLIAKKYASKVYVTDDNPRYENPNTIRKSIIAKCSKAIEIPNRRTAIKRSIYELNGKKILIIAGKGHEDKQIVENQIMNFDDVKIAKYYLDKCNNQYEI